MLILVVYPVKSWACLELLFSNTNTALPLLSVLGWISYTVGPSGPSKLVRMHVNNEERVGPVWNVIGLIPGTLPVAEDRPIVLGNHRDAWVFGAVGERQESTRFTILLSGGCFRCRKCVRLIKHASNTMSARHEGYNERFLLYLSYKIQTAWYVIIVVY